MDGKVGARILAIDDDHDVLDIISSSLGREGYDVQSCDSPGKALLLLSHRDFDLVLLDIIMPEMDGMQVASHIINNLINVEIVVMTVQPDEARIDAFKEMGISHFLFKPFSVQHLIYTVYAALYSRRAQQDLIKNASHRGSRGRMVGISSAYRYLQKKISLLSCSDLPILIEGETGTGKELIAREIHAQSRRNDKPFLPVNCATLGSIAESELFGHVSGAFTDAKRSTRGYVGSAEGGTLFLDEIGELPLPLQSKLLRFLENGEYMRVGESRVRMADIRIISATNHNIENMCHEKRFRQDLYYRIRGACIKTVPLRARPEDIPVLVWHFLQLLASKHNRTFHISPDVLSALCAYEWPGNVRELRHTIHLLCDLSMDGKIRYHDVAHTLGIKGHEKIGTYQREKEKALYAFDMKYFSQILMASGGKLHKALEITGMHKKNFYIKIKQLGLSLRDFSQDGRNSTHMKNPERPPRSSSPLYAKRHVDPRKSDPAQPHMNALL
ncbi:MAG: sigma-54-dependent Fis family transcriptional regulator [Deltaproteobacteria bacterium]|nr:sigma-54-dependent Fis family transcriptional regulator [Deltaproteobacteria bacterium]MBW2152137.1 sigma-54-dependent Fis family transcriptional regulator [Deltaproteobacteria bacterium]